MLSDYFRQTVIRNQSSWLVGWRVRFSQRRNTSCLYLMCLSDWRLRVMKHTLHEIRSTPFASSIDSLVACKGS
jgi:hypothetical protein